MGMANSIPISIVLNFRNFRILDARSAGKFLAGLLISGPGVRGLWKGRSPLQVAQAGGAPRIAISTPRVRPVALNGLATTPWIPAWGGSPAGSRGPWVRGL